MRVSRSVTGVVAGEPGWGVGAAGAEPSEGKNFGSPPGKTWR